MISLLMFLTACLAVPSRVLGVASSHADEIGSTGQPPTNGATTVVENATTASTDLQFPRRHSISGISSGGGSVANHLVAFSSKLDGAAIVAGNPYGCGSLWTDTGSCNYNEPPIALEQLYAYTSAREKAGKIDPTSGLKDMPLYLYSGTRDTVVYQPVMDRTRTFFTAYVGASSVEYVNTIPSEHGYITDDYGECCGCIEGTYILNCHYDQPGAIFAHIYGKDKLRPRAKTVPRGNLRIISQQSYAPADRPWPQCQMAPRAYVYVPTNCQGTVAKLNACRVHINYHGCGGAGSTVPRVTGYNAWGEANDIVVVYPQAKAGPGNPTGCWDWTGVTGSDFDTHSGAQIGTVLRMINDLPNALADSKIADDDDDDW